MKELKRIKKEITKEVISEYSHDDLGHLKKIKESDIPIIEYEIKKRFNEIKSIDVNLIKLKGICEYADRFKTRMSYKDSTYEFRHNEDYLYVIPDFSDYVYCYDIKPIAKFVGRFKSDNQSQDIKSEENENE